MSFSGIEMRMVRYAQELSSVFDIGVQWAVDSTETLYCSETIDSIWNKAGFAETLEDKLQLYLLGSAVNQFGVKLISNSKPVVWETSGNHAPSFLSQAAKSPAWQWGLLNHEEPAARGMAFLPKEGLGNFTDTANKALKSSHK